MRNVLCEAPPNWRMFRVGCRPYDFAQWVGYDESHNVLLWRVSDLPADRVERLFNHDQIAPVLAGLKAQAEPTLTDAEQRDVIAAMPLQAFPLQPAPTKRRPLVVGDLVMTTDGRSEFVGAVRMGIHPDGTREQFISPRGAPDGWWKPVSTYVLVDAVPREGE